ncbi:MAG: hypothetical protein J6R04_04650 [Clostridia bacterium]|nr:hypothetical protein [Clostridia bacterium]
MANRAHFDYGNVHVVLDVMTGELFELINKTTGDNLLKNGMFKQKQPFTLALKQTDGRTVQLSPPPHKRAFEESELRPTIASEMTERGVCVTVTYDRLWNGEEAVPFALSYTMTLTDKGVEWRLRYTNTTDAAVTETRFPVLNGMWLGETSADDTLVYPQWAGMRYVDPQDYFTRDLTVLDWRWQEYEYRYVTDGVVTHDSLKLRGLRGQASMYPGDLSMSWMDLYDADGGIYFGVHDPASGACRLEAGVAGKTDPGICLAACFAVRVGAGERYESAPVVTALHTGDWHVGADIYRAFRRPTLPPMREHPAWMTVSAGLHAHYDFKYQSCEIVHTYRDIPRLAREAKEMGLHHMLLSGWHKDGFDRGFPCYRYDPDLGTEQEFAEGVRAALDMGVHVSLYMNLRLFNNVYDAGEVADMAVMNEDGSIRAEGYGSLRFSLMCPNSQAWQDRIAASVAYATEKYGVDGIYFDQLGTAMCFCFNAAHKHGKRFDAWYEGYQVLLDRVSREYYEKHGKPLSLMGEMVCDRYGTLVDLQLNELFVKYHTGGFPEMYRYTLPEHGIVDMLYPEKNMAMRPVHVGQRCRALMARHFCCGETFWIYDLVDDNTFTRDSESESILRELIAVRKTWLDRFGNGIFLDEQDITYAHCGDEFLVKHFVADDRTHLLPVFNAHAADGLTVTVDIPFTRATVLLPSGEERAPTVEGNTLTLPPVHACLVILS